MQVKSEDDRRRAMSIAESNQPLLRLCYEDAFGLQEPATLHLVSEFLGITTPPGLTGTPLPSDRAALCSGFTNWPEVIEAFVGTPFEADLGLEDGRGCESRSTLARIDGPSRTHGG